MEYEDKVKHAIKLLQSIPQDVEGGVEISYSGGKDSDVILELAKMSGIPYEAIYKNTTIDPPGTIRHCRDNGVTILNPKQSMFEIIEQRGWPTRRARFCCSELKEYKVKERAVQGIRRSESAKRKARYKEPEICRVYSAKEKVRVYLPILEWTNEDIERFIKERGIKCHPLYYDEAGNFHVERRLGCIGCPMQADNGKKDFRKNPRMLKQWIWRGKKYLDNHPSCSAVKKFGSAYNLAYHNLFCHSYAEYLDRLAPPLFAEYQFDAKKYLEEYFEINLDFAVARDLKEEAEK